MPPRSRRSPAAGRAAPPPPPAPAEDELEPADVDVVEPTVDTAETSAEPAASASRRGRAQSGRGKTGSGRSSRQISARSAPRKVLTPEEIAARRRARNQVFAIFGILILLGALGAGVWYVFVRKDERVLRGQASLADARRSANVIESNLQKHQPDEAQQNYDAALKSLATPELGYAKESYNDTDPQFAGVQLWQSAKTLYDDLLNNVKPRIEKSKRDQTVEQNVRDLRERFSSFAKMDDAALLQLGKDVDKFLDNPVDPEAGRSEEYAKEYDLYAVEIRSLKSRIADEQRIRREKVTSAPVRDARYEVEKLINEERFKDALAKVDDVQRQFKDADLAPIRDMVTVSAKTAWDAAKKYADTNYTTSSSPGSDQAQKASALAAARHRMQQVVDRFGIDEYVDQAKAELSKYGQ